jgi:biopolymer transport protein TolQ
MFQSGVTGLVGSLGAVSKIVLLLLLAASIISWGVIFYKWRSFKAADREDQRFFNAFTKIRDLDELYRQSKRAEGSPSARVFQGIMDRVWTVPGDGLMGSHSSVGGSRDQAASFDHQYMDKTVSYLVQNQVSQLESYLPILATTGNITPFISARSDCKEPRVSPQSRRAFRRRWWRLRRDCLPPFRRSSFTIIT